jgi:hypothetical protein
LAIFAFTSQTQKQSLSRLTTKMLQVQQVSPLKLNRKRSRVEIEDQICTADSEMDLDEDSAPALRAISDLNIEELKIAQIIAQEQLKNSLFINIDFVGQNSTKNPFLDDDDEISNKSLENCIFNSPFLGRKNSSCTNSPCIQKSIFKPNDDFIRSNCINLTPSSQRTNGCESNFFAPLLYSVCELFLGQQNVTPSLISSTLKMTSRSLEIKEILMNNNNMKLLMEPSDTTELARIIVYILERTPCILVENLKSVCRGILAINQATTISRRIGKTNMKFPNALVKSLTR